MLSATTLRPKPEHCRSAVRVTLAATAVPQVRAIALWAPQAKTSKGRSARNLRIVFIFLFVLLPNKAKDWEMFCAGAIYSFPNRDPPHSRSRFGKDGPRSEVELQTELDIARIAVLIEIAECRVVRLPHTEQLIALQGGDVEILRLQAPEILWQRQAE